MEMKTNSAVWIFALKTKGIYTNVTADSQMELFCFCISPDVFLLPNVQTGMNISIICTPQVLDSTVYLWLMRCAVKNRKGGRRVSPRTWLPCFTPLDGIRLLANMPWTSTAALPAGRAAQPPGNTWLQRSSPRLLSRAAALMNSWALSSQDCNRSAHVHQHAETHTCIGMLPPS